MLGIVIETLTIDNKITCLENTYNFFFIVDARCECSRIQYTSMFTIVL